MCIVNLLYFGKALAQQISITSISVRAGLPVNDNDEGFRQYDIFADVGLPVCVQSSSGWTFNMRLDAVASVLNQQNESAFLFSLGPGFLLTKKHSRLALKFGSSPTFLSDARFPNKNLGGHFHFISHIGVTLRIGRNWHLIYRIQHLSNASTVQPNPGLNLHVLGLGVGIY
ncbi:MAG: acyloxyacyl hydrolase [bacterium]